MTDEYIARANVVLSELNEIDRADNLKLIVNNYWEIYREAKESKDHWLMMATLKEIGRVKGLDQQTINHVVSDERKLSHLSDEELDQLLEETRSSSH